MKQIFFDFETTGVTSADAPVQVAGLICEEFGPIEATFNEKIKTTHRINPAASAVHGIYAKDLVNCRMEREVLKDFILWTKDFDIEVVVGHNIKSFDLRMLETRCGYLDLANPFTTIKVCDTRDLVIAARKQNLFGLGALGRRWSLPLTAELLGIKHENAHDALGDIITNKLVYDKLKEVL